MFKFRELYTYHTSSLLTYNKLIKNEQDFWSKRENERKREREF